MIERGREEKDNRWELKGSLNEPEADEGKVRCASSIASIFYDI
jgi:hypothetical protein